MKSSLSLLLLLASVPVAQLHAQLPGGVTNGMNSLLPRLFGQHSFSAKAEVLIRNKGKESLSMDMTLAVLDRKLRAEVDLNRMKSDQYPPTVLAQLKVLGMDRMISITAPDAEAIYLIYPGLESYIDLPLSKEQAASLSERTPLASTRLGREEVQGQLCIKNQVILTDETGHEQNLLVWNAPGLNHLPLQIQMEGGGSSVTILLRDVRLSKPDAKQFEPAPAFARFDNVQQMMMQRLMPPAGQ